MDVEKSLLYIFFAAFILLMIKALKFPPHFPPGPRGFLWPLMFKYYSAVKNSKFEIMDKFTQMYGPVLGFYFGPLFQPIVVASSPKSVIEALNNSDLQDRPVTLFGRARTAGFGLGFIFSPRNLIKAQKRFAIKQLHQLGYGKSSSDLLIQEEISLLFKQMNHELSLTSDRIFEFRRTFRSHTVKIMWKFLAGTTIDDDVPIILKDPYPIKNMALRVLLFFLNFFHPIPKPVLRVLPSKLIKFLERDAEFFHPINQFIMDAIENQKSKKDASSTTNFIELYLKEIEQQRNQIGDSSGADFNQKQLVANVLDLFDGSYFTTDTLIGWFLLYMIHYPEVQTKIQLELDEVCGDGLPLLEHRSRLPYTEATLMEVLRLRAVIPYVVRSASEDTKILGYHIPKNSSVLVNINSVLMDESYWNDAKEFRPERHLSSDGEIIPSKSHFIPFGLGTRSCIGEALSRQIFFLFSASIIKTFNVKPIPEHPLPSLEPRYTGLIRFHFYFKAMVIPRELRETLS